MGKYRHYGSHGYLMPQRPSVHSGKTWWNDFSFAYMAGRKSKADPQFLQATELLPERLLIPLGGRFVYHWEYLEHRWASPQSIEQWVPIQDPKSTDPLWYIPYLEGVGSEGATLSTFLAPVTARSHLGPNIGFTWLPHWPVGCGEFDYLYRGRLWLVTLRPIHAGAFLRANVRDAWKFYSWGRAATELAQHYERVFVPGAPRPILGSRVPGFVDCDFSELEYTSTGVPKLLGYYNMIGTPAPESPPSTESTPFLAPTASAILGGPFEDGLLSRAEVFTPRGGLHPKAYDVNSNFLEDGRPLPFPELCAWWTAEVERVTMLRANLGLPEFSGPELTAIRARSKRYRKHGSDGAIRRKASSGTQPRKRLLGGPESSCSVPEAAHGPLGAHSSLGDSKVNNESSASEGAAGTLLRPPRKARSIYKRRRCDVEGASSESCSSVHVAAMGPEVAGEGPEGSHGGLPSGGEVVGEGEGDGRAAPLPGVTEYLAAANVGDHIPSREETRRFFERVIDVLGGLANDLHFVRENVFRHMRRVLREE